MPKHTNDRLQGTLDLLILKSGPRRIAHGYAIAQRIHQATDDSLRIEEGSLYPALQRMTQEKWLRAQWGTPTPAEGPLLHHHPRRTPPARRRRTPLDSSDRRRQPGAAIRLRTTMSPLRRLWNAFRRRRMDDDLQQEIETHLALIEERERANGSTRRRPGSARARRSAARSSTGSARSTPWSRRGSRTSSGMRRSRCAGWSRPRRSRWPPC